jgi:hypothetical protein
MMNLRQHDVLPVLFDLTMEELPLASMVLCKRLPRVQFLDQLEEDPQEVYSHSQTKAYHRLLSTNYNDLQDGIGLIVLPGMCAGHLYFQRLSYIVTVEV